MVLLKDNIALNCLHFIKCVVECVKCEQYEVCVNYIVFESIKQLVIDCA